jgi:hypothetical protein
VPIIVALNFSSLAVKDNKKQIAKKGKEKKSKFFTLFIFQDDNFVLSAIFCAIEENNLEGLDKLLSMANIDVNQVRHIFSQILNLDFFWERNCLYDRKNSFHFTIYSWNENPFKTDHLKHQSSWNKFRFHRFRIRENML